MEDENADRVYVPGTNPTPPARDVEPFWPPEELGPPVHGGRPVPHDAPTATSAAAVPIRTLVCIGRWTGRSCHLRRRGSRR